MRSKFFLAAALVAGTATSLSAQTEISGFAGTIVPLRSLIIDTAGGGYFKLTSHTVYGIRFAKTMSPSLGLEFQLGTGAGDLDVFSASTPLKLPSSVYFADVRVRVRLMGGDDASLVAIGGAGWTQFSTGLLETAHELDANNEMKGVITGIVGLGFRAKVSDRMSFTLDVTDRIHAQVIEVTGATGIIEKSQHSATVMAGLAFPLGN